MPYWDRRPQHTEEHPRAADQAPKMASIRARPIMSNCRVEAHSLSYKGAQQGIQYHWQQYSVANIHTLVIITVIPGLPNSI